MLHRLCKKDALFFVSYRFVPYLWRWNKRSRFISVLMQWRRNFTPKKNCEKVLCAGRVKKNPPKKPEILMRSKELYSFLLPLSFSSNYSGSFKNASASAMNESRNEHHKKQRSRALNKFFIRFFNKPTSGSLVMVLKWEISVAYLCVWRWVQYFLSMVHVH